jgi:hypothetical protein
MPTGCRLPGVWTVRVAALTRYLIFVSAVGTSQRNRYLSRSPCVTASAMMVVMRRQPG